jgi:hypothetical protein
MSGHFRRRAGRRGPALGAGAAACVCFLLSAACGYQIQLSTAATATPRPLNVHVIGGVSPTPGADAASLQQLLQQCLGTPSAGCGDGQGAQPAAPSAPAVPASTPAPAVAAPSTQAARYAGVQTDTASTTGADAPAAATPPQTAAPQQLQSAPLAAPQSLSSTAPAATATPGSQPEQPAYALAAVTTPTATLASAPRAQTSLRLQAGFNDIIYTGPTVPGSQACAALAGMYSIAYITPPGQSETYIYQPGFGTGPAVVTGSPVRIVMTEAATVDLPASPAD